MLFFHGGDNHCHNYVKKYRCNEENLSQEVTSESHSWSGNQQDGGREFLSKPSERRRQEDPCCQGSHVV